MKFKLGCYRITVADGPPKDHGWSAGHRCNRLASNTPVVCLLSKSWTVRHGSADGPQVLRKIWTEAVFSGDLLEFYKGRRSTVRSRTVRACAERWGRPDLTYMGCLFHLSPPNRTHPLKALSFLSQARGRNLQGGGFLAWFPDGPSTSPDSSQDSTSCPLGIPLIPLIIFVDFTMKEARVWGAPIYFLAIGFMQIVGGTCS